MAGKVTRKRGAPLSLREQALASIKKGILDSLYPPGSLLSEGQLAEELRISRTPIREAMRELAAGGLVRVLPQRGIIVTELAARDVIEVYQIREQLECFAVRVAAELATPADLKALEGDHREAIEHIKAARLRPAYDASVRLHTRVISLAGNGRLSQIMTLLGDQVHRFGLLTLRHGRADSALSEHGEIIAAIEARDADAAERLMRAHLRADRDVALRLTLPAGISTPALAA
ncbi:GntR family transcriptional regulator [Falsiroseomonas sp. HW251]|uniref:GntR family transcriptional regulator n=1 Tax=Falsiroseomonas sp. HW251 TaxID=3390998 RepID=UPI003D3169F0